jgi:hypothetical protein
MDGIKASEDGENGVIPGVGLRGYPLPILHIHIGPVISSIWQTPFHRISFREPCWPDVFQVPLYVCPVNGVLCANEVHQGLGPIFSERLTDLGGEALMSLGSLGGGE